MVAVCGLHSLHEIHLKNSQVLNNLALGKTYKKVNI